MNAHRVRQHGAACPRLAGSEAMASTEESPRNGLPRHGASPGAPLRVAFALEAFMTCAPRPAVTSDLMMIENFR